MHISEFVFHILLEPSNQLDALLNLVEIGRETTDLDFLLTKINASESEIEQAVAEIVGTESTDGFSFHYESIELKSIFRDGRLV